MERILENSFLEEGVEITEKLFGVDADDCRVKGVARVCLQHVHYLLDVRLKMHTQTNICCCTVNLYTSHGTTGLVFSYLE